jgi:hypothetical protein
LAPEHGFQISFGREPHADDAATEEEWLIDI